MSDDAVKIPAPVSGVGGWLDDRFHGAKGVRVLMHKVFPDHWSFMLGEIALWSFVILLLTGTYLALFFQPSMADVVYHGSYAKLNGIHTIFGQCDAHSVLIVATIARVERNAHDKPLTPVVVNKVTIVPVGRPIPPLPSTPSAEAKPLALPPGIVPEAPVNLPAAAVIPQAVVQNSLNPVPQNNNPPGSQPGAGLMPTPSASQH